MSPPAPTTDPASQTARPRSCWRRCSATTSGRPRSCARTRTRRRTATPSLASAARPLSRSGTRRWRRSCPALPCSSVQPGGAFKALRRLVEKPRRRPRRPLRRRRLWQRQLQRRCRWSAGCAGAWRSCRRPAALSRRSRRVKEKRPAPPRRPRGLGRRRGGGPGSKAAERPEGPAASAPRRMLGRAGRQPRRLRGRPRRAPRGAEKWLKLPASLLESPGRAR
mmetsp:Transcript_105054/g.279531  ORF Transcript_105054/g.279531 Transcript_105054/m.279531 type:complete len:222 (+) Transcript_105054:624-1289(+)